MNARRGRGTLTALHTQYRGRAEGDGGPWRRDRLVGEATLRAVRNLSPELALDLSAVGSSDLGTCGWLSLKFIKTGASCRSAIVRGGDPAVATAKAVLDAVNRLLTGLSLTIPHETSPLFYRPSSVSSVATNPGFAAAPSQPFYGALRVSEVCSRVHSIFAPRSGPPGRMPSNIAPPIVNPQAPASFTASMRAAP